METSTIATVRYAPDATFVVPFRDQHGNWLSFQEIMRYIHAHLPDDRPISVIMFAHAPGEYGGVYIPATMTITNYKLAYLPRGIIIRELREYPQPLDQMLLSCDACKQKEAVYANSSKDRFFCSYECYNDYKM